MAMLHSGLLPDDGSIYESMADFFTHHFDQALTLGWHAVDPKLRQYLSANVQRFSGFKTYAVQQAMREKLTDAEGNIRPFADFRADALEVNDQYNVRYLRTEYEQAIAAAQMASKWADFAPGSLLRYDTAGDDRVRHDHAIYDGIVRPKDDAFWDSHFPPCDWGCRCDTVEVDDDTPVTPATEIKGLPKVPEEFRTNAGKTGEVFGPEHPYFDVSQRVAKKLNARAKASTTPPPPKAPAPFDAADLQKLQAMGITVKGGVDAAAIIENARVLTGADLPQLAADMEAVAKKYRFKWDNPRWLIKSGKGGENTVLKLDYMAETRNETLLLQRLIVLEKGKLHAVHELLDLPEAMQGSGFSQMVNKALYKQYQAVGVQTIRVHAALDAGGYVWARVGFSATKMAELQELLEGARAAGVVPSGALDFYEKQLSTHIANKPREPFPIWKWARTEHGKDLLLGSSWHGQLDLKNEEQTAIFERYLNAPPKPKKPKK
ncbi:phage minor head protein [Hymenobacter negativus]|uniref:Phage head morphogenesis domain-containing protein n=1 Tax=Hymenobacter negativus TaxID=2795026 RepID=A0ABS3QD61_9BACT|nr:phage minor head protein [Hymenobacter negativus]MBO2009185.1 hypothetical protein [Hymenobacter negativus]